MSERGSSMDVEDVLSSIRRLVSEEAKGAVAPGESAVDPEPAGNSPLTQPDPGPVEDPVAPDAATTHAANPPSNATIPQPGEGEKAGIAPGAAMSFRHQAAQSRAAAEQKLVLTAALRVGDRPDDGNTGPEIPADTPENEPVPDREGQRRPHLRSVESWSPSEGINETATPEQSVAPEKSPGPDAAEAAPDPESTDSLFERAKFAMMAAKEAGNQRPAFVFEPENGAPPETATEEPETPAEVTQTASGEMPKDPEPPAAPEQAIWVNPAREEQVDNGDPEPVAGIPADADAQDREAQDADAPSVDEPTSINFVEEEESILDEDTLRDMVSEMVRSELQGELGDRITRNVRKLVRREIQRALASREFE